METTTAPTTITKRCDHRSDLGLGCARTAGHTGSHWLTSQPQKAHEALKADGFFQKAR